MPLPAVTALRERTDGRVEVEVDGVAWRTLPSEVVVGAGILPGVELDRPRLRTLRRELRRSEAVTAGARALRVRELSVKALEARLERRGIAPEARGQAIQVLARAGLVDDERFASLRAAALATRGKGDAAIRWTLERDGVPRELVERALERLEPEVERATRVAAERGRRTGTARFLAARGFSEEAVEQAIGGVLGADEDAALG
jgi:SOS response regulatory protein OraA/RecX